MQKQYIKGGGDKPFDIVEDDRNDQNSPKPAHRINLHRYVSQLDKLSQATKNTLKNKK
jgi:hypothetical protein